MQTGKNDLLARPVLIHASDMAVASQLRRGAVSLCCRVPYHQPFVGGNMQLLAARYAQFISKGSFADASSGRHRVKKLLIY